MSYDDALNNKVFFKDFNLCLGTPTIHAINEFIADNKNHNMKAFINNNPTKPFMIEVYDDFMDDVLNLIVAMPVACGYEYQVTISNDEYFEQNGTYEGNLEEKYSWSDMANELTNRGIPHEVVKNLADVQMAICLNRPVFNIFKFDDYLHNRFGNYENDGKSMSDIFKELFGNDLDKMAYYFGINKLEKNEYRGTI